MTEAAVAEDVEDHVLVEFLAEFGGDFGGMHHGLGVVAVDVEDRRFDHQGDVGGVGRGAAEGRGGGEADLVVHHDMDAAAGAVALDARKLEAFGDDALACEGRIAVQKDRQHLIAVGVAQLVLLGADLAEDDGVHRLKVRGVRGERQVHGVGVKGAVGGGAEVVFHVARAIHIFGLVGAALEFVENRLVGLLHHVGQDVQTAPVRHADDDVFHAMRAADLDDGFHRGDQRLGAVQTKALGPHVFDVEELFVALSLNQLVQDGAAAFAGEGDFLAVAFDALFQPRGLLGVGDVHVLQGKGAAIGAFDDLDDLAHRGGFQPQHIVDEDRAVHVGFGKAVGGGVKFRVAAAVGHAQGVQIGGQMAADAVGADQHDGADAVEHRALDLVLRQGDAFFDGLLDDLFAGGLGLDRPFAGERGGQVIGGHGRPIGAGPRRACGGALGLHVAVAKGAEELGPACINRGGVGGVAGGELVHVIGIGPVQERRGVEAGVWGLFGHGFLP